LTVNALTASARVLVPTIPDYLSLRGLLLFLDTLGLVRRRLNPGLQVLGVLPTMYDARLLHGRDVIEAMERHGIQVLPMRIARTVRVAEAMNQHRPVWEFDPGNPAALAYLELGRWVDAQTS
jgi:chromosome partitioning protein